MKRAVEYPFLGHPDKVCDLLVETLVDEYLRRDPFAELDVQALGTSGMVLVGGVVDSQADFAVGDVLRETYRALGYDDNPAFFVNVEKPHREARRVEASRSLAQGTAIVYGYATRATREMLPSAVVYAQSIARRIETLRTTDARFSWLRPDGKVQVIIDDERVSDILLIACHAQDMDVAHVQQLLLTHVLEQVLPTSEGVRILINPGGSFTVGGFVLNTGVSGRKVIADCYGGLLPHGGASFVGKNPAKPVRAGTYMARFVARSLVRAGVSDRVLVQLVYGAGLASPIMVQATTYEGLDITEMLSRFDFRPDAIVERFDLRRVCYQDVVRTGFVGSRELPWERDEV